jgi:pyridoxamine 5'-phosphate oxidase family protein
MSAFTADELGYLRERRLGRIATVGHDGTPHVTPVGWSLTVDENAIEVSGNEMSKTKKFRDVARSGRAAIVIDELVSVSPWHVRGIEIRGAAQALPDNGGQIRIHPDRVISWGLPAIGTQ